MVRKIEVKPKADASLQGVAPRSGSPAPASSGRVTPPSTAFAKVEEAQPLNEHHETVQQTAQIRQTVPVKEAAESSTDEHRIQVAIRVRPLIGREANKSEKAVIDIDGATVSVLPAENAYVPHARNLASRAGKGAISGDKLMQFSYDKVFDTDANQDAVYKDVALEMVDKVTKGYHGCIFAYGQTSSGKTFTMMGSKDAPGITYRVAKGIRDYADERAKEMDISIRVNFLEIYQENLKDLLVEGEQTDKHVQLREDAQNGVFVQNVTSRDIFVMEDIERTIALGSERRTVGSTKMNEASSRSHSVFTINLTQQKKNDTAGLTLVESRLHLIDLAGSERAESTGATGQRLKEGAVINQSLSALGNVINALVEKRAHIPYRSSKLTRLLTDSLGGNSMTYIIANISPGEDSREETISTLRFASRAKQIKNKPVVNVDPKIKRIQELEKQLEMARLALTTCHHCHAAMQLQCNKCHAPIDLDALFGGDSTCDEDLRHSQKKKCVIL